MKSYSFDFSIDPFVHFERLLLEAQKHPILEYNAMALSTSDVQGFPNVRIVYFKGMVRGGLSFYTNYLGQKGREIESSNKVSVNFYWPEWNIQIRIRGEAFKLKREENESYFRTRPRLSQLGAWASNQSEEIENLFSLERKIENFEKQYEGKDVPCPEHWGGYRIMPLSFEFWFGREGRIHERYIYERTRSGTETYSSWDTLMRSP